MNQSICDGDKTAFASFGVDKKLFISIDVNGEASTSAALLTVAVS